MHKNTAELHYWQFLPTSSVSHGPWQASPWHNIIVNSAAYHWPTF